MRCQSRWTQWLLGGFLASYLLVGVYDQIYSVDDIYPYSDWYLFSFVNKYGSVYDLKSSQGYLVPSLQEHTREKAAMDLFRLSKLVKENKGPEAQSLIAKFRQKYDLQGDLSLVKQDIERMEYFKDKKIRGESLLFTWSQ